MQTFWSSKEDAFLKANWRRMSATRIGKVIRRTKNAVIGRARRRGYRKGVMLTAVERPWRPGDPVPAHLRAEWAL